MRLKIFDVFVAEGDEREIALYTALLIEVLKNMNDIQKKKEVEDWMKKYGDKTFEELMKSETREDDKTE